MRCLLLIVAFLSFTTPAYAHHIYSTKAVQALEALVASDGTIPISTDSSGRLVLTQPLLLPDGTTQLPAIAFTGSWDGAAYLGIARSTLNTGAINIVGSSVVGTQINSNVITLSASGSFRWAPSTTADVAGTQDLWLSRHAAGHVKVTTDGTTLGTLSAAKFTTTGTGTYAFTLGNTETVGSLNTQVTFKTPGAGVHAFHFANTAFTATSSFSDVLYTDPMIQPGSGSGSFAVIHLNPTINGPSTGIAYGLGIASKTNVLTGGTIKPFSVGTTTTNLFTGYTPLIEIDITGYIEGKEQTAPAAPAANGYRLFAQDNGAGKTQLMVIFATGVAQQIAIEP